MADKTGIEWTDSTFNPWIGCTKVSPACDNCYAEAMDARAIFGGSHWGAGVPRKRTSVANWRKPLAWNSKPFYECECCGWRGDGPDTAGTSLTDGWLESCPSCNALNLHAARRRVFCASMADVFDSEVDPQWRIDLLELIAATPNLDWLLLTKRIGNAERLLDAALDVMSHGLTRWRDVPWPNVWLGSTICNQAEADRDIPKLLAVPAAVRFLSIEPMLGPVDIQAAINRMPWRIGGGDAELHWVIVGGESGPTARPMSPQWARDLRDQCRAVGVPVRDHTTTLDGWVMGLAGKKAAGRLLDGVEHNGYPEARP